MKFGWISAKLAIFTVFTIVVTGWLASVIGNIDPFGKPYEVTAEFSDVTGVLIGDQVKAAGVTVGRVRDIQIDDGLALVTLALDDGVELPDDVEAEIRFRNLVGQRIVTLVDDPETPTTGRLKPGDNITLDHTKPAFDLGLLFNGLRPLIRSTDPRDINIVTAAVTQAFEGRSKQVEGLLGNLSEITETLAGKDEELDVLLDNVNIVTEDLAGRDAQLRSTLGDLNTFLTEIAASRADLENALVVLDDAARRIDRVFRRNDDLIKGEVKDLAIILDAVNDKRADLRLALRRLPGFLNAIPRVTTYGQWSMIHLVDACKDDFGTCGTRGTP